MKQMIQRMREEKGGFTLAELLIVVAIVAVLVAIAIPVFTGQLAEAQKQTDAANIRGGYATVSVEVLDDNLTADTWYGLNAVAAALPHALAVHEPPRQAVDETAQARAQQPSYQQEEDRPYGRENCEVG